MNSIEHAHHTVYQDALSRPAAVPVSFIEKPADFIPVTDEYIEPMKFSMVLDNVARNMGKQIRKSEEKIAEMAHDARHDKLTGTLTKQAILGYLDTLIEEGAEPEVYYLDFNNFKAVNDWAGHAYGDKALVTITASLLNKLRNGEEIGRMGGDEFVIVKDPRKTASDRRTREDSVEYTEKRTGSDRRQTTDTPDEGVYARVQSAFEDTVTPLKEFLGESLVEKMGISIGRSKFEAGKTSTILVDEADYDMYLDKERSKINTGSASQ